MDTMTLTFTDTEPVDDLPRDSVPVTVEVEHPCDTCGRETGWSGRGRRKKQCDDCKPKPKRSAASAPRVSGNASNIAAQAAKTLVGLNNVIALTAMAVGLKATAKQIMDAQADFEGQAYQALLTDPKFAASLLSAGQFSGKAMLGMAYFSMGVGIAPIAMAEIKAKKAEREAEQE